MPVDPGCCTGPNEILRGILLGINELIGTGGVSESVNISTVGGVAASTGCGVSTAGTLRVAQATDCTVTVAGSVVVSNGPGAAAVNIQDGGNTITVSTGLSSTEDAPHVSGDLGIEVLSKRTDVAASSAGADGDYATINTDSTGRLWTTSTILNGAGAAAVNIQDGGNSITIDGTVSTGLSSTEDSPHTTGDLGVMALGVANVANVTFAADGDYIPLGTDLEGSQRVVGNRAHDAVDAGNPLKVGFKAIAHGTNPTAVAAADRTDAYANRAGVPFVIGGHPNVITFEAAYTAAQTDAAIVTVAGGLKIVVTAIDAVCDNANTVNTSVRVGFGAANTPTTTGVVLTHPGIAAGSGIVRGSGSGIMGVGADGEDLRITSSVPTGGSLRILVSYYTIES